MLGEENEFYRYTNISGDGGHKTGYETSLDMGQPDWQIQYAVDQSYFSTIFHPADLNITHDCHDSACMCLDSG